MKITYWLLCHQNDITGHPVAADHLGTIGCQDICMCSDDKRKFGQNFKLTKMHNISPLQASYELTKIAPLLTIPGEQWGIIVSTLQENYSEIHSTCSGYGNIEPRILNFWIRPSTIVCTYGTCQEMNTQFILHFYFG